MNRIGRGVPAPDLPTTREIEPVGEPDRPRVPSADDPGEAAAQLDTLTGDDVGDAEIVAGDNAGQGAASDGVTYGLGGGVRGGRA